MSEATMSEMTFTQEELNEISDMLRSLHVLVLRILGARMTKAELAKELGISVSTLMRRVKLGHIKKPLFGLWLEADFMENEHLWRAGIAEEQELPVVEPEPIGFGQVGHHLYRHFDSQGVLLYVGVSMNPQERLRRHKDSSPWFSHVARVEMTIYKTRADVLIAERIAIQREKPRHNIVHSTIERATA